VTVRLRARVGRCTVLAVRAALLALALLVGVVDALPPAPAPGAKETQITSATTHAAACAAKGELAAVHAAPMRRVSIAERLEARSRVGEDPPADPGSCSARVLRWRRLPRMTVDGPGDG
jgi:hypothetical protein